MTPGLEFPCPAVPQAPGGAPTRAPLSIAWEGFDADWIAPMAACIQDP